LEAEHSGPLGLISAVQPCSVDHRAPLLKLQSDKMSRKWHSPVL
jgi:hypothetical protein